MRTIVASSGLLGTTATLLTLVLTAGLGRQSGAAIGLVVSFAVASAIAIWAAHSAEERLLRKLLAGFRSGDGATGDGKGFADGAGGSSSSAALSGMLGRLRYIERESRSFDRWAQDLVAAGLVSVDSPDGEISATAAALAEVGRVAGLATRDSRGIAAAMGRLHADTIDQQKAAASCISLVEETSAVVDRIARDAHSACGAGQEIRTESLRAAERAREAIRSLDRIRAHVEINGRKIRRHGDRSIEIGAIVDLIGGISQRTDTLVLNATIESVRAGEHGRGFALVAEEIRKLAERTSDATKEIAALVEVIQSETQESTLALEGEQVEILHGVRRVREVAATLEQMGEVAEQSARLTTALSQAAGEQTQSTRQAARAARRIAETTERLSDRATQIGDRYRSLANQQERLHRLVSLEPSASNFQIERPESLQGPVTLEIKHSHID